MKFSHRFVSAALCAALLLATPAFAWRTEKQDLTEAEVTFDPSVDPEKKNNAPSGWAEDEIMLAGKAGLIPALTDSPRYRDTITREQFAELVVNMVENVCGQHIEPAAASTFSDCANEAVLKANAAGIVNGVGGDRFDPKGLLDREQLAAMLYRAWDYLGQVADVGVSEMDMGLDEYIDAGEVSSWACYALDILTHADILKGSNGKLMPKDNCTVEQSILLVYRLYADHVAYYLGK